MASNKAQASPKRYYDPTKLLDASEHHEYSRAMGLLTWGTWDYGVRPVEQRVGDFVSAFPPEDPTRFSMGGSLVRQPDKTFAPGTKESALERFLAEDWRPGSFHELLSRYGLTALDGPEVQARPFVPDPLRETARRRNVKLRVLHGGVDVEPANMDAAKASFLDIQEKKQAAIDVRAALKQMEDELSTDKDTET